SDLLAEEEEDTDASDMSSGFAESIDSTSILDGVDNPLKAAASAASPTHQVVGTPPRGFTRSATVRRGEPPKEPELLGTLPPPRPLSTIRPMSMIQPRSLLTAALKAKKSRPFESFASLSGQGDPNPIALRIYATFSKEPSKPFEVLIRRSIHEGEAVDRSVTVAELIGLSLFRYYEEARDPPPPADKLNGNW